jgi:hypothetical protein
MIYIRSYNFFFFNFILVRRVLGPCVAAKNKPVRGDLGGSPGHGWTGRPKADNILLVRWGVTFGIRAEDGSS